MVELSLRNLLEKNDLTFQDTSLPTAVFVWDIENNGESDLEASITFTFKNGQGVKADSAGGCWSEPFQCRHKGEDDAGVVSDKGVMTQGVSIHQTISGQPCSYNIAAAVKVGDCAVFLAAAFKLVNVQSFHQLLLRLVNVQSFHQLLSRLVNVQSFHQLFLRLVNVQSFHQLLLRLVNVQSFHQLFLRLVSV